MKLFNNRMMKTIMALSGILLITTTAEAAEESAVPQTQQSEATVQFQEYTGPTAPRDPNNPSEEYEPTPEEGENPRPSEGSANGPLSLDYVSSIHFGENKISMFEETYESTTLKPFIQVTDRRAVSDGWRVTVEASPFTQENDKGEVEHILTGVKINLNAGSPIAADTQNTYAHPTVPDSIVIEADGATTNIVAAAGKDEARDTWLIHWLAEEGETINNKVTLTVPGGKAEEGTYTSTLTWTLSNAPH